MKKDPKTTQLGLRISNDMLQRVEELAEAEMIDKMTWIRQAIADKIDDVDEAMEDQALDDFICGRTDESRLKAILDIKSIPNDILNARKEFLGEKLKKLGGSKWQKHT